MNAYVCCIYVSINNIKYYSNVYDSIRETKHILMPDHQIFHVYS